MRIVHIEDFFHPNAGYQINILPKYLTKLGHENIILTTDYKKSPNGLKEFFGDIEIEEQDQNFTDKNKIEIIRLPIYSFKSGRAIWKVQRFLKKLKELHPDVLYFHGNDTFIAIVYLLFFWNKTTSLIFDSHMLDMASKNKFSKLFRTFYKMFISPKINKNNIFVIRVQDSNFINEEYSIFKSLTPYISFGTDVDVFNIENFNIKLIKKELGIADSKVYLYSGKLDETKGGLLLAEAFEKQFEDKDITLIIIGNIPKDKYGEKIRKSIASSENRIIVLPTQNYNDLAKFYAVADYAVFPKQCSLSFYDFQSMGIPIIFEDNEINRKRLIVNGSNNFMFRQNDVSSFRKVIEESLNISEEISEKIKKDFMKNIKENYNYNDISKQYEHYIIKSIRK